MGVKVLIEFTTDSYDYQVLKNDTSFEECFQDNEEVMDLVERLHNSNSYGERTEIAEELWEECGYDDAARMLHPEGHLEVTFKKGGQEDIDELRYEVLDSDWVEFAEFFDEDTQKSSFCIIKNNFSKRAHHSLETELDEPFSGEFLKIEKGSVFYKDQELEFTGDSGGWYEDEGVYVFGSDEVEEDDSEDDDVDIDELRENKLKEILSSEIKEYEQKRKEIFDNQDAQLIALWKECGIPDAGEQTWEELWEEDIEFFMRKKDFYLKRIGDEDERFIKWERESDPILDKANELDFDLKNPMRMEALKHEKLTGGAEEISSWDESTRQKILAVQKQLDELDEQREKQKLSEFKSTGYVMYGYDDEKCEKLIDMDITETLKKFMESLGEVDIRSKFIEIPDTEEYEEVFGKDCKKYRKLVSEWEEKVDAIDSEYMGKKKAILSGGF